MPGSLLVAVSGGSDSVALLHILCSLRKQLGVTIGVAHVNHGLRGTESDSEEDFVRVLSRDFDCSFHCIKLSGAPSSGIEEWARQRRYSFFHDISRKHGYDWIATGHTRDDQVETVLMRLIRGTGLNGLRGIHPVREDRVIRPLLKIGRDSLRTYLRKHSVQWCEDSSNQHNAFQRNKIRHTLVPVIREQYGEGTKNIAKIADLAAEVLEILQPRINTWIKNHVVTSKDSFRIGKDGFTENPAIIKEACALIFRFYKISFSQEHLHRVLQIGSRRGGQFLFPSNWTCFPFRKWLFFISREGEKQENQIDQFFLSIPGKTRYKDIVFECNQIEKQSFIPENTNNNKAFFDASCCGIGLTYRQIRENDLFQPLGSSKNVSLLQFLKKRQVPVAERKRIGVLTRSDGAIIWVPSVEISQLVRVTKETEKILEISSRHESLINVF